MSKSSLSSKWLKNRGNQAFDLGLEVLAEPPSGCGLLVRIALSKYHEAGAVQYAGQ